MSDQVNYGGTAMDFFLDSSYYDGRKSDLIFSGIIVVMSVVMVLLWREYRKLQRTMTTEDGLDSAPHSSDLKEHLHDAIMDMKELLVPSRNQRFRKRDRFYFYGRRIMRKMAKVPGEGRRKAISRLTQQFLR